LYAIEYENERRQNSTEVKNLKKVKISLGWKQKSAIKAFEKLL
jgi:hypothetical protein